MYRESSNSQEKKITKQLVVKFNEMLNSGVYIYFDSVDIEKIIDYYIEKKNEKKIQYAFNLYEKIYPFSQQLSRYHLHQESLFARPRLYQQV